MTAPTRRTTLRRLARQDDGVALVVSTSLIGLVGVLALAMLAYAIGETRASGRDRQRSSAVTAAEGRLDLTLSQIQNASTSTLPCGQQAPATSQQSAADSFDVVTTVTYYDAAGLEVACTAVPTTLVTEARVVSQATSDPLAGQAPAVRTMETLVRLTPTFRNGFDKAIFGEAGIAITNRARIYGQEGRPDADIYTNGDFTCNNNQEFHGSVYAQGSITLASNCRIFVDAHAGTFFKADNPQAVVSGNVLVAGGNATLDDQASVGQQVRATGTITWSGCTTEKCVPGVAVPPVPTQEFPQLVWNPTTAAEWAAEGGFTNVVEITDCTVDGDSNPPGKWILDNAGSMTANTVLVTPCEVVLQRNSAAIELNKDLLVFADGGISFRNSLTIRSTAADERRRLYLIQPYDAVSTHPCYEDGIELSNQVTVEPSVDDMLYSPCNIRKSNNSDHYGQIYAGGQAIVDNSLTMFYRPLPVFGVVNDNTVASYALDTQYKRETR